MREIVHTDGKGAQVTARCECRASDRLAGSVVELESVVRYSRALS